MDPACLNIAVDSIDDIGHPIPHRSDDGIEDAGR